MFPIFDKIKKFSPSRRNKNNSPDAAYMPEDEDGNSTWEWYDIPEDSPLVNFFKDTSLHGLQYLGQRKRHLCERLFWFSAFTAAVVTATILIWQMWYAYLDMPIITVFNPTEKTLNEIPFPAVTICNVNNIQKSKMKELMSKAKEGMAGSLPEDQFLQTLASLMDIYNICEAVKIFTSSFVNSTINEDFEEIAEVITRRRDEFINLSDPIKTHQKSCKEMILFCVWLEGVRNCSNLFQAIDTDYGRCCTFNTIPVALLLKHIRINLMDDSQRLQTWIDADIDYDNLIFNKRRKYPRRQRYPGRSAGLSILLNPDLDEYYCTNTDSVGFVLGLNVPLDFPRMRDNGIAVRTNSEVFIAVRPEVTVSDESAKKFTLEKRGCLYSHEQKLHHYSKYTKSNCVEECIANITLRECECIRYYLPNSASENEKLCRPSAYNCADEIRKKVVRIGVDNVCQRCLPTCTEIAYHTQTTTLEMRPEHVKNLLDQFPEYSTAHNVSILHVYFNVDSTYPRLRKEMTTVINLISNAGGLLGLCMGFSILSLLEIIYHATIRLFCTSYRECSKERKDRRRTKCFQETLNTEETKTVYIKDKSNMAINH